MATPSKRNNRRARAKAKGTVFDGSAHCFKQITAGTCSDPVRWIGWGHEGSVWFWCSNDDHRPPFVAAGVEVQ